MIYIHKGDCTTFAEVTKFLVFNLDTEFDVTGWKAEFTLWELKKTLEITSKTFDISLSGEETSQLPLGELYGELKLIDANGNIKTLANKIPFYVTFEVTGVQSEKINLEVPETTEIKIDVAVGQLPPPVTSVNSKIGNVVLTAKDVGALPDTTVIPDITPLATKEEVENGLKTKQPTGNYALKSEIPTIPTNISYFNNDVKYLTQIPSEFITEMELVSKGYLTEVPSEYITETELNSKGYLTKHQDISHLALKSEIPKLPANVSYFNNDANYLTEIPSKYITEDELNAKGYLTSIPKEYITESELNTKGYITEIPEGYVTESELNEKGYLTEHQDISNLALKSELPTKVSDLTQDINYLKEVPEEYVTETELINKVNIPSIVTYETTTVTIDSAVPNTVYKCGTISSLTITSVPDSCLPIILIFTTDSSAPSINLPATLESINLSTGFESGKKYIIAIENNMAVMGVIE